MNTCYDCGQRRGYIPYTVILRHSGQEAERDVLLCKPCIEDRDAKDRLEAEYYAERKLGA